MPEEAYGKVTIKRTHVCGGKNVFVMAVRVSVTICTTGYTQDLVRYEFIREGSIVNKEMKAETLRCLRDAVRRNHPENGKETVCSF
jgi:hypothetical protein